MAKTSEQKAKNAVLWWLTEIEAAKKREKEWRKDGTRILEIYSGEKKDQVPFNILFSNTETLLPALYSATPRPVVTRRFKDEDAIAMAAGKAGERGLAFLLDTNVEGYETYDEAMRSATLDALLPGRGVTTIKYDAEIGEMPTPSVDDEAPVDVDVEPTPYKESELVCCDTRSWNRVYFGYAKKWSKVPWICFEEQIDRQEAERLFGAATAAKLKYMKAAEDTEEDEPHKVDEDAKGETKLATVYQIWDKDGGRKLRYCSPALKDEMLKVESDPLGLTGFYPLPKPLCFIEKSNDLTPTAPYLLYENQAEELNRLTVRINRLLEAIKARGAYDASLGEDIQNILKLDDNQLVPTDRDSSLASEKGLEHAIWFWPVDKLIQVLRELYVARESCKQVIFEIMGLADIMRGTSQASETLGAQEIKQAWGGLRLKRSQKEVQRYARDILRLMLELAATKFSEDTWARMTGLPYLTEQQFMEAQSIMAAAQGMIQPGMPPPPELHQQMQQAQQTLQQPRWSQVLDVLRDDIQRSYKVDIETNSTVEPEAVEDQKNIAEVMNALGQFLNGVGPLVVQGVMPFQAAQSMMLAIVRRFRFGDEIEEYIKQMQKPKNPDEGKQQMEQAKAQQEQQQHQMDMQAKQQEMDQRQAEQARDAQLAEREAQLKMAQMDRQAQYDEQEHLFKMAELAAKTKAAEVVNASKIKVAMATAAMKEKQAAAPKEAM